MRSLLLVCLMACTGDVENQCDDPAYGNGTCDLETTCGIPDIDCFETFEIQADAQAWYARSPVAANMPPAPATDRRFAKMNELLLQGWEAYKDAYDLGDLAPQTPQLVLLDSPAPNAFAMRAGTRPEDRTGLAVMVTTGLIDLQTPDDSVLGVVMHELAHGLRLHLYAETKARLRSYYVARAAIEPIGRDEADDPTVRTHGERWLAFADEVGYLDDAGTAGLPLLGKLALVFDAAIAVHAPTTAACTTPVNRVRSLQQQILGAADKLSGRVTLAATAAQTILTEMTRLRDECFANFAPDVIKVAAAVLKLDEAELRMSIPADLRPSIEATNFITGIYNWVAYSRRAMRKVETDFTTATGVPWERLRYFSTEEDADDTSVVVLDRAGLRADAITDVLLKLKPGVEAPCREALRRTAPIPYGDNLTDDHHADCWRGAHARDYMGVVQAGGRDIADRRMRELGPAPKVLPLLEAR